MAQTDDSIERKGARSCSMSIHTVVALLTVEVVVLAHFDGALRSGTRSRQPVRCRSPTQGETSACFYCSRVNLE